jgi:enamine deaminase RidA (YjgF/YER057c/UK114 family)
MGKVLFFFMIIFVSLGFAMAGERNLEIKHLNPEGLPKNPAFSQAISIAGPHKTVYIGEQNAVDERGIIVGKGDVKTQTEQVFRNLKIALSAAGASLKDVVTWKVFLVNGQSSREPFQVFQKEWGPNPNPPTVIVQFVSGLAHPDFLVGMDAVAVRPL